MRKNILIFIAIVFSIIIEVSFLPSFFPSQRVPSLVLILVIFLSARDESKNFWKWAFLAGICLDIIVFQTPGLHAFSFLAISLLTNFISKKLLVSRNVWNFFIMLALFFLGSLLNDLVVFIFLKAAYFLKERKYLEGLTLWGSGIFYRALYSLLLGIIFYKPMIKFQSVIEKKSTTLR